MATSSLAGRSRGGKVSVRTHRPKVSTRHTSSKSIPGDAETAKPDVDELRQRRAAYFARPVAERQKVMRPNTSRAISATSKAVRTDDSERRRKKRSHKSSSSRKEQGLRTTESAASKSADYVYNVTPGARADNGVSIPVDVLDPAQDAEPSERRHRQRSSSSSHGQSVPRIPRNLEQELTPDDSISVVAERRSSSLLTSSSRSRPSLKRSITTSSKLPIIDETTNTSSVLSSRRSSKRDSTLLGSLLRRQSTSTTPIAPRLVECLTCGSDHIPHAQSAKLACGHRMCHECLIRVFNMSVNDPAHMPPRCCTDDHIPLKHVDKLFDLKFKTLWNRKYQEYHTKNRIYCPAPKCGEWIKPSHIHRDVQGRKHAHCPRCKTKVCTLCNNKMHRSKDCPDDPETAKLVDQAKEKGWQRCFNCSSMVELKEGCNHMTCRCLAEFCMVCGSKWKTCECPWFAYSNLPGPDQLREMRVPEPIQAIYRRVYNAAGHAQPIPAPPPQAVQPHERTYQQEMDHRRRQERLDAELARRLQLTSLMETQDQNLPRARPHTETWGLGNAAGHFMNEDFVQNAANVVMAAFGDANMGRRGERVSGRRRRARVPEQGDTATGLVPNFLGDESVLGAPAGRAGRAPV
ncbi:hypothetical protein LTR35_014602 [Friedmanniomyces endolithicus]|uniref:RBR-type E3 ubiquitin transferase n=1 Tax=Friedmanniomyces endolithicus TaxID=329885 RepID=A0AAN6F7P6_9PEZI|nr:hypothetical protein LTR35_014602 [Friedmanniomyces endolithicus]KAK0275074.1 hypothetical protein LTS00_015132 [Friedmanniomyces endolithicus]KAK0304998.1 hypothetical protein LTR82_017006 [Friedmanniomyces endolithicus]KAK0979191.1 hypothetical protein LTR54_015695 [Friedmanniomyces endolithicus]